MKPERTMHQLQSPLYSHAQNKNIVEITCEGQRIVWKIAKNQLNKIKIKPCART
jgi:hypothetical protein